MGSFRSSLSFLNLNGVQMRRMGISQFGIIAALGAGVVLALLFVGTLLLLGRKTSTTPLALPGAIAASPASQPVHENWGADALPPALYSCAQCHALPPPESLARADWPRVLDRMNATIEQYELGEALPAHALEEVKAYYAALAPARLDPIPAPEGPAPVRFVAGPIGRAPTPPPAGRPPIIGVLSAASIASPTSNDVLAPDIGENRVSLLTRTGNSYAEVTLADITAPCVATSADMDGDGDNDVLVASLGQMMPTDELTGSIHLLENKGRAEFEARVLLDQLARVADVEPADLDGDGDQDVLFAAFGLYKSGEIGWLEQTEQGAFAYRSILATNGATHVRPADFDGDGRTDFVALLSQQHETVLLFRNLGSGRFVSSELYKGPHPLWGMSSLTLADLDADGDLDVVVTNGDALDIVPTPKPYHGVSWLENTGGLEFTHHRIAGVPGAYSAAVADFDLDGDQDIVVSSMMNDWEDPANQALTLLENDGAQQFTPRPLSHSPTWQVSCLAVDLNGDDRPDVISSGMYVMPPFARVGRLTAFLNAASSDDH
ncbi:MAG: FG-GAP repeat domain-containing protein [Phycisphaerales bacterium]